MPSFKAPPIRSSASQQANLRPRLRRAQLRTRPRRMSYSTFTLGHATSKQRNRLPLYIFAVTFALIGLIVLSSPLALASPTTTYPRVKNYLVQNLDHKMAPQATKKPRLFMRVAQALGIAHEEPGASLEDTGQILQVKYTLGWADKLNSEDTLDKIFADPDRAGQTICAQYENYANVYDTGSGDNYVAFLDATQLNGAAKIIDVDFAEDNLDGKRIRQITFDKQTGIAYIPKTLYEKDGKATYRPMQAQLLLAYKPTSSTIDVYLSSSRFGISVSKPCVQVTIDPIDATVEIPVISAKDANKINIDDLAFYIGDSSRPISLNNYENASYDPASGKLTVAMSGITMSSVRVEVLPSPISSTIVDALTMPKSALAANSDNLAKWEYGSFKRLDVSKLKVGQTYSYSSNLKYDRNADHFADITWANVTLKRTARFVFSSFENGRDDYSVGTTNWIFNQLKAGAGWEQIKDSIREEPVSTMLQDVNFIFTLPGNDNKTDAPVIIGGLDWSGLTSPCHDVVGRKVDVSHLVEAPAFCTHISQPANRLSIQEAYDDKSATTTMHVLSINLNTKDPYVLIGFCTPEVATQSGIAVIKFGVAGFGELEVTKQSSDPTFSAHNETYSLEGAHFRITDSQNSGLVVAEGTTNKDGKVFFDRLPIGSYVLEETIPPKGFVLTKQTKQITINAGTKTSVTFTNEPAKTFNWKLFGKYDSLLGSKPQGEASLAGAQFKISHFGNLEGKIQGSPLASWIVESDASGKIESSSLKVVGQAPAYFKDGKLNLPLGTYAIQEIRAPKGYTVNTQTFVVVLSYDWQSNRYNFSNKNGWKLNFAHEFDGRGISDTVIRGGVKIEKQDAEGLSPRGGASLAGTEFQITYTGKGTIVVNGVQRSNGDVVATIAAKPTVVDGKTRFIAATSNDALPYGSYSIKETKGAKGYLSKPETQQFSITDQSTKLIELKPVSNQILRGGLRFNKVDESMSSLQLVPFLISAQQDSDGDGKIEQHLIVCDENGIFSTSETLPTNYNDKALKLVDGSYQVDEALLDPRHGIWFSGRTDTSGAPSNKLAPLPYGTYEITELPCSANRGKRLVSFTVSISSNNTEINRGTIINESGPEISTYLSGDNAGNQIVGTGKTQLVDTVSYKHLDPGKTYRLEGTLYLMVSGEEKPVAVSEAQTTFKALGGSGDVEIVFDVDTTDLGGSQIVATEMLFNDSVMIAEHTDLADENQTVTVASLSTQASVEPVSPDNLDITTIQDSVSYTGLIPGEKYTLIGQLIDRDTEEVFAIDNKAIESSMSFVPEASSGSVAMPFSVPSEEAAGRRFVVYESLFYKGTELCDHKDMNDPSQQVSFPSIKTTLTDEDSDHYLAESSKDYTLIDTVVWEGLEPKQSYTVEGTLMDSSTAEPILDEDGNPLTASTEFVADKSSGETEVEFKLSLKDDIPQQLVAFERLYDAEGFLLTSHEEIDDKDQTVYRSSCTTSLTEKGYTDDFIGLSEKPVTLIDTITYQGLIPGTTYKVTGQLVSKDTGETLKLQEETTETTVEFVAEQTVGTVEVEFVLNPDKLPGKTIVAYEKIFDGDTCVCSHEDIEDVNQSIYVPSIKTTLSEQGTTSHEVMVSDSVELIDEVQYHNLIPGKTYEMQGMLVDAKTGDKLVGKDGSPLASSMEFVPESTDGVVCICFHFDSSSLADSTVVAFETMTCNERVLAIHHDLSDENQSVTFIPQPEPEEPPQTSKTEEAPPTPKPESPKPSIPQGKTPKTGDPFSPSHIFVLVLVGSALMVAARKARR